MKSILTKIICVLCLAGLFMFFFGTDIADNIDTVEVAQQLCIAECEFVLQ